MPSTKSKRPKLPRTPNPAWLAKEYADLLSRPNVVGCFIGRKRTKGRATRRLSVICAVREKVDLKDLDPKTERVPEEILWLRGKARPGRLPTDIQVLSAPFRPASGEVAGPGDGVFAGTSQATIGIALQHPTLGDVVTTAGHLVLDGAGTSAPNLAVQLAVTAGGTQHAGSVLKAVRSESADYALVRPADLPCENLFADQHQTFRTTMGEGF